jgi:hypothetical protein
VDNFKLQPVYPLERPHGAHGIRGWVGPRAVLDVLEKRKIYYQVTDFQENLCEYNAIERLSNTIPLDLRLSMET